ncbi:hypothetical protein LVD17_02210 [Fulvivirga ulvae]|uniref:hypothetical protein n=1 Tax=Fulvivirga ulvae TaxID=2904245 RepID=UPI001F18C14D|nr:hypothetical protein [Fulvivirga ulvae]UII32647.1 hypothetical protein LVD17_02210 [Fulvivirga ulvae]
MNGRPYQLTQVIKLFQWICFMIFISRAYQHLFWDAPFRTLLWDESLLKGFIEFIMPISWVDYVTSPATDTVIQDLIRLNGLFYLLCAVISVFLHKLKPAWGYVILAGAFSLIFLAFLYTKEKFFNIGQFFEYSIQFSTPILLFVLVFREVRLAHFITATKVIVALTFICHGLYAIGYYPRPGSFVDMTINTLYVSEAVAHSLLFIAGLLDFIVAVLIFIPLCARPALYYMVVWGFLTATARLTANVYADFFWSSLHQWWFEFTVRLPHAMLPLAAIILITIYTRERYQMTFKT